MGEVHYVIRHGKRIEVETVDFGGLTPVKRKKVEPFAKVPLKWAAAAAKAMRSPPALIMVELLYASWRAKSRTFPLANARLAKLGTSRNAKYRVLRDLERAGLISVGRAPRKALIITLNAL
jgi:hypothetical protein